MISAPSLQIYLQPCVTQTFNLLTSNDDHLMPLPCVTQTFNLLTSNDDHLMPLPRAALHQNRFIRYQNIVFTSLLTEERTDRWTDRLRALHLHLPVSQYCLNCSEIQPCQSQPCYICANLYLTLQLHFVNQQIQPHQFVLAAAGGVIGPAYWAPASLIRPTPKKTPVA